MKKILTLFLCCLLAIDTTLHAMLFIPGEEHKFKTIQRIPTMSLEQIGLYVETLPTKKSTSIKEKLSQSLTFNVAILPADIRRHIALYMFHGNKNIAEEYYKKPLLHLCTDLHNERKATLNSSLSKEKQEKSAVLLLALPTYQKTIIHDVINPSFGTRVAYDGPVISADTLAMIGEKTTKKLFKNQDIIMVQALEEKYPLCVYTTICLVLTSFFTGGTAAVIHAIPLITCFFFNYCPDLSPALSAASTATQGAAIFWLYVISTSIRKRNNSKKIILST